MRFFGDTDIDMSKAAEIARSSAMYSIMKKKERKYSGLVGSEWYGQRKLWGKTWGASTKALSLDKLMGKETRSAAKMGRLVPGVVEKKVASDLIDSASAKTSKIPAVKNVEQAAKDMLARGMHLKKVAEARVQKTNQATVAKQRGMKKLEKQARKEEKKLAKIEDKSAKRFVAARKKLHQRTKEGAQAAIAAKKLENVESQVKAGQVAQEKRWANQPEVVQKWKKEDDEAERQKAITKMQRQRADIVKERQRNKVRSKWIVSPILNIREANKRKRQEEKWAEDDVKTSTRRAEIDAKIAEKRGKRVISRERREMVKDRMAQIFGLPFGKLF